MTQILKQTSRRKGHCWKEQDQVSVGLGEKPSTSGWRCARQEGGTSQKTSLIPSSLGSSTPPLLVSSLIIIAMHTGKPVGLEKN